MPEIKLLNQETIDKIAAGEVVERPASVVKELVENAIDAKATAVTVEIKEGGLSLIRITDNGCGIPHSQAPIAFLRHSTSKIEQAEDLLSVTSLGFRGEALSSIAAVSQVELITKTYEELTGTRYVIEGSKEIANEEIGAPEGTTFLVRNLFYNVPARRKFLRSPQTEGNYISDCMERLALSHPEISFKFIHNGQTKMHTSGNSKEKDLIYHIYGRDITAALLPIEEQTEFFQIKGFIGKPLIARGNRNYENYFINGRYIKSSLLSKAVEEAYKGFLMQRQYPFCVLYLTMDSDLLDVNVHPTKMELRFSKNEEIYRALFDLIRKALTHKDFIPEVGVDEAKKQRNGRFSNASHVQQKKLPPGFAAPEPFEQRRLQELREAVAKDSPYERKYQPDQSAPRPVQESITQESPSSPKAVPENLAVFDKLLAQSSPAGGGRGDLELSVQETVTYGEENAQKSVEETTKTKTPPDGLYKQRQLEEISEDFLTEDARKKHQIIGCLFDTYWLVQYEDKLFIIDQHAAHEKVLYEKTMKKVKNQTFSSQRLSPPVILTLNRTEAEILEKYRKEIAAFGYEAEPFGGKEYAITAIPADFTDIDMKAMFLEMLDDFANTGGKDSPELILEKVASMSCKAAIKGRQRISRQETEQLIDELLQLENPYHCPHGRPTIISMSRYEIEKKFKRII